MSPPVDVEEFQLENTTPLKRSFLIGTTISVDRSKTNETRGLASNKLAINKHSKRLLGFYPILSLAPRVLNNR